jgi:type I restriction enzyme S subunit
MEEWKEYKLGDISTMKYGKLPPSSESGKYPVWSGYRYVGMANTFNCAKGTLVVVARGVGGTGDVKVAKENCYLTNLSISVDIDTQICNPYFLHYKYLIKNLRYLDSGSAQSQITIDSLKNLPIEIPSLVYQNHVVAILKSLDDKIEVNRRINENLEQQAQALFKSWFVDFEPFRDGEFVESELGMIPKGWRVGKLGELCTFKRGKNLLTKNSIDGGVPVVAGGLEPSCFHNVSNTKAPVITVSGSGANAGFMRMYYQEVWASDCSFIDSTCKNLLFVYCFLAINKRLLRHAQTGAVQPHVKPSDIHDFDIVIPPQAIIEEFQTKIDESIQLRGNIEKENVRLASLRDTLLPKLMSGELRVSDKDLINEI